MDKNKKELISVILNTFILGMMIGAFIFMLVKRGSSFDDTGGGLSAFRFFTVQSNIYMGIVSLIYLINYFVIYDKESRSISMVVKVLKLTGTASVAITLLTVVFYLFPITLSWEMFTNTNLFMHFLIPVVSIVTYIWFDDVSLKKKFSWFTIIPVGGYGLFYFINVAVHNGYGTMKYDWYGFGQWGLGVSFIVFIVFAFIGYGVSILLQTLRKKANKNER